MRRHSAEHKELLQRIKETERNRQTEKNVGKKKSEADCQRKAEREKARLKEQERLESPQSPQESQTRSGNVAGREDQRKSLAKRLEKKTLEQQKLEGKG